MKAPLAIRSALLTLLRTEASSNRWNLRNLWFLPPSFCRPVAGKASAAFLLVGLVAGCATADPDAASSEVGAEPARAGEDARETESRDAPPPVPVPSPPAPSASGQSGLTPPSRRNDGSTPAGEDEARAHPAEPRSADPSAHPVPPGPESPDHDGAPAIASPPATASGASTRPSEASDPTDAAARDRDSSTETLVERARPPPPPEFVLAIESRDSRIEMPVEVPTRLEECDVRGEATVEGLRLSLLRYAPSVTIHERIVRAPEGEGGFLVLHVTLETPDQLHDTWLVPGSRVFGRAAFPAARVECLPLQTADQLAATRELLRKLQSPGAKVLLEVKSDGRRLLFPAREGEVIRIADPDYALTVERIFGNFALDPKSGNAYEVGGRPFNPALQARIEHAGRTRTAWLFSQLPAFSREAEDAHGIFSLLYPVADHPHQRAEITLVDGGSGPYPVFLGRGGELHEGVVEVSGATTLAGVTIGVPERITSARVKQTVQSDPRGRPAVLVAWRRAARDGTRWIPLGTELELRYEDAVFFAQLRPGSQGAPGRSPHGNANAAPTGHAPPKSPHRR